MNFYVHLSNENGLLYLLFKHIHTYTRSYENCTGRASQHDYIKQISDILTHMMGFVSAFLSKCGREPLRTNSLIREHSFKHINNGITSVFEKNNMFSNTRKTVFVFLKRQQIYFQCVCLRIYLIASFALESV